VVNRAGQKPAPKAARIFSYFGTASLPAVVAAFKRCTSVEQETRLVFATWSILTFSLVSAGRRAKIRPRYEDTDMLRIERQKKCFTRLEQPSCADASITERYGLQEFIFNSAEPFFAELGQKLFVIGQEVQPSEVVQDRVDLLALDPNGNAVVIELKRGNNKLQLLQAVAYAGMIAKWKPEDFLSLLSQERSDKLVDFLDVDTIEINREQRILLIAEAYDYEVLVGAEWLHNKFDVDILCCRISLATDAASGTEYLSCTYVFPAPELAHQAVPRRAPISLPARWEDWDDALSRVPNTAEADYFKSELAKGRDSYLLKRILRYRIAGRRRFEISAKNSHAFGWQAGRFKDDEKFWAGRISDLDSVKPVADGRSLRFFLTTAKDFSEFQKAVTQDLLNTDWTQDSAGSPVEDDGTEEVGKGARASSNL